jgi:hypothetical protein
MAYVTAHIFRDIKSDCIKIPLPQGCPTHIAATFAGTNIRVEVSSGSLCIYPTDEMESIAVLLKTSSN